MSIDPSRCLASGPGFNGGGVGQDLKFMVTACDENGNRIKQGGAEVMVFLTLPRGGDFVSSATVKDNGDGTYEVNYKAPETRGFYDLSIEINGSPACNSPLPIFFTDTNVQNDDWTTPAQPEETEAHPSKAATTLTVTAEGGLSVDINPAELQGQVQAALAAARAAAASQVAAQSGQLPPAVQAALLDASPLTRLWNLHPSLNQDTLTQLFSFAGPVKSCRLTPKDNDTQDATLEFHDAAAANKALVLNGQKVGNKTLRIEKFVDAATVAASSHLLLPTIKPAPAPVEEKVPEPAAPQPVDPNTWRKEYEEKKNVIADSIKMYAALLASNRYGVSMDRLLESDKDRDRERDRGGRRRSRSRSRDRRRRSRSRSRDRRRRSRSRSRGDRSRRDRSRSRDRRERERDSRRRSRSRSRDRRRTRSRSRDRRDRDRERDRRDRDRSEKKEGRKEEKRVEEPSKAEEAVVEAPVVEAAAAVPEADTAAPDGEVPKVATEDLMSEWDKL